MCRLTAWIYLKALGAARPRSFLLDKQKKSMRVRSAERIKNRLAPSGAKNQ
jgi:hypothetical protein